MALHLLLLYAWQIPLLRDVAVLRKPAQVAGLYVLGQPSPPPSPEEAAAASPPGGAAAGDAADGVGLALLHLVHFVVLHLLYAAAGVHAHVVKLPLYRRLRGEAAAAETASAVRASLGAAGGGGAAAGGGWGAGIFSPAHLSGEREPLLAGGGGRRLRVRTTGQGQQPQAPAPPAADPGSGGLDWSPIEAFIGAVTPPAASAVEHTDSAEEWTSSARAGDETQLHAAQTTAGDADGDQAPMSW